jgi:chitosanase
MVNEYVPDLSRRVERKQLTMRKRSRMNERELAKIRNVLVVAECGTQVLPYGDVYIMADGPGNVKQITLSIGFTQYGSNLGKVIEEYSHRAGKLASKLEPMLPVMKQANTVNSKTYISALKEAGSDPIMQRTQDDMFNKLYLKPAVDWGEKEGFKEPLSYLIIADSFLHSGSILSSLRSKFPEKTPANGGDERKWITSYLNARHSWLLGHSNSLLQKTVYRTKYYKELIAQGDWALDNYHTVAMNGVRPAAVA